MEAFDSFVNTFINPLSIPAGVGTVFLTFFSSKIAPKMPQQAYDLLDNMYVRVFIITFLINQQIKKPSLSIISGIFMVFGIKILVDHFAPETPPLSELVKDTVSLEKTPEKPVAQNGTCNCYCGTIYTDKIHESGIVQQLDMHNQPAQQKQVLPQKQISPQPHEQEQIKKVFESIQPNQLIQPSQKLVQPFRNIQQVPEQILPKVPVSINSPVSIWKPTQF